jgi:fructokinase
VSDPNYALVEAGGTKFVLGVGSGPDAIRATTRLPTTTPDETIAAMLDWFAAHAPFTAFGLATFGPVELDRASPQWGHILATPKPHWEGTDLAGALVRRFDCPLGLDTDVNAAALAEWTWGAGIGQSSVVYLTVGTGIGGGAVIEGRTLRGLGHPEMGHMRVPRHPDDAGFAGSCPFHGDCLEGLASGTAITKRWGAPLSDLPTGHLAHEIIAWTLAQAVVTVQALLAPGRVVLGGGVMHTPGLIGRVTEIAETLGADYFRGQARDIVALPGLGDRAGLMGALALAQGAAR